jgi:hypothetical protein
VIIPEIAAMTGTTHRLSIRSYAPGDLLESWELMQGTLLTYMHMDVMPINDCRGLSQWLLQSYDTPSIRIPNTPLPLLILWGLGPIRAIDGYAADLTGRRHACEPGIRRDRGSIKTRF